MSISATFLGASLLIINISTFRVCNIRCILMQCCTSAPLELKTLTVISLDLNL